jgi:hypothetical protein
VGYNSFPVSLSSGSSSRGGDIRHLNILSVRLLSGGRQSVSHNLHLRVLFLLCLTVTLSRLFLSPIPILLLLILIRDLRLRVDLAGLPLRLLRRLLDLGGEELDVSRSDLAKVVEVGVARETEGEPCPAGLCLCLK